ncbi:hypothetical protein V1512DRAFT_140605 [Lipomyces arxii]|uniref:uncharacterized protein n=1 Tax=Lipomyces arxii TaxID=56418 RepID=UPI0034CD441D
MVGVPGGSKGCANCRKRKIKCDETAPQCLRCIKANRICTGPVVGSVFKLHKAGLRKAKEATSPYKEHSTFSSNKLACCSQSHRHLLSNVCFNRDQSVGRHDIFGPTIQNQLLMFAKANHIPRELSLFPAYDLYVHCINTFIAQFEIDAGNKPVHLQSGSHSLLIDALPKFVLNPTPSSTTFAARALVVTSVTQFYNDPDVSALAKNWFIEALRYQKSLINLIVTRLEGTSPTESDDLLTPEDMTTHPMEYLREWSESDTPPSVPPTKKSVLLPSEAASLVPFQIKHNETSTSSAEDDAVTASLFLAVYEILYGEARSWIKLLDGTSELVRLRGPQVYKSGLNGIVFESTRGLLGFHALLTQKPTFLSSNEWMTVPRDSDCNIHKVLRRQFFDYVVQLPDFIESVNRYMVDVSTCSSNLASLDPAAKPIRAQLRPEYCTEAVFLKLRDVNCKLQTLQAKFNSWANDYNSLAADAGMNPVLTIANFLESSFDASIKYQSRCPSCATDDEWIATHFFKPGIMFQTPYGSRISITYYALQLRTVLLLLQTSAFSHFEFGGYMQALQENSIYHRMEMTENMQSLTKLSNFYTNLICQTVQCTGLGQPNVALVIALCAIKACQLTLIDPLEQGFVCHYINILDKSPADTKERNDVNLRKFEALSTCQACGERVRPPHV